MRLTSREMETLRLLSTGLRYAEIAQQLGVTTEYHGRPSEECVSET